jgi:OOP family OmpA-OmpF porin
MPGTPLGTCLPRSTPRRRVWLWLLTCVAMIADLAGCSEEQPYHGSLAYVYDAHANSLRGVYDKVVEQAVVDQRQFVMVPIDGDPQHLATADLRSTANNAAGRDVEREDLAAQVRAKLNEARPKVPEVNLLDAIFLASRELTVAPKFMTIDSSCLSTKGALQFQQDGMIYADPKDVADDLARRKLLPDLRGIKITLRGCGDVVAPQEELDLATRTNLIAIWVEVLTRAGAEKPVIVDKTERKGEAWPNAPYVTPIKLAKIAEPGPRTNPPPLPAAAFFKPDEATLIDQGAAIDAIRPLAAYVLDTGSVVSLLGTTARDGTRQGQIDLSVRRAEVIRGLFIELGVPAERVSADGAGSYSCKYVPDLDASGNLLPDKAAQNRAVHVAVHDGRAKWDFCKNEGH